MQYYRKYRIFGTILAVIGVGCTAFGFFSGHFILIPPSALNVFLGIKYLLVKPTDRELHLDNKPAITFFPTSKKRSSTVNTASKRSHSDTSLNKI